MGDLKMGFYDSLDSVLSPVLDPFLKLNPLVAIILLSFILALIITIIYKYMTDQELMKTLKSDIKSMQKEMKQLRDKPQKMMEVQKKAFEKNMKYMMQSMKPTLVTFIPIILIFGWLSGNFAYEPVSPGEKFSTYIFFEDEDAAEQAEIIVPEGLTLLSGRTSDVNMIGAEDNPDELPFDNHYLTSRRYGKVFDDDTDVYFAGWELEGKAGKYTIEYVVDGKNYFKDVIVSRVRYEDPIKEVHDGTVSGVIIDQGKLVILNIFGWGIGWLGTYIIFSIIFSMGLRKILKLH
ncbi:MAG: EMC3/TMCO1 family protein [Candidatus Woesearchaeota archaeon]